MTTQKKITELEAQFGELILGINQVFLDSSTDNKAIFELNKLFYKYGHTNYLKGIETAKEIYNL